MNNDDALDDERDKDVPAVKRASDQAARYRVQRREARERADAAEARERELKLELAFVKESKGRFVDVDAAWKLLDHSQVSVNEDGSIDGMNGAIDALTHKNPFLLSAAVEPEANPFKPTSSGRSFSRRNKPVAGALNRQVLEAKFPALRRDR
jgi:hypothetical protein